MILQSSNSEFISALLLPPIDHPFLSILFAFFSFYFTAEHRKLQGVAEQLIKFESLRQNFEKRFVSHLNKIIVLQVGGTLLWED